MSSSTRGGLVLALQQYRALLKKNALLSWRGKRATMLQFLSPLIFIFLIFAVDKAIKAQTSTTSAYKSVTDPPSIPSPPIPPCEDKFFVKLPCYDFVWSGDQSPKFQTIVGRIMDNNPGRPIPASKVKSFGDKAQVDTWLFSNPMHCPAALHFAQKNDTVISYGIQTNSTSVAKRGKYEDPTLAFQLPLQLAAEREIARYLIGGIIKITNKNYSLINKDINKLQSRFLKYDRGCNCGRNRVLEPLKTMTLQLYLWLRNTI